MKILFTNKYFYLKGGSETVFFQERKFLLNNGHKVIDFSMEHPDNLSSEYYDYFAPSVDYSSAYKTRKSMSFFENLRMAINFVHNRKVVQRLTALIQKEKPDIAHLHNIYHQLTPAIIPVLKNAGARVVLTLHDYKLICPTYLMFNDGAICNKCEGKYFGQATINRCQEGSYFKSFLLSIEGYWHKWMRSYDKVDLFLCPSQFLGDMVSKYRIDRKRIRVLHNGIDVKIYNCSEPDDEYVIYFGRISKEKGVETLLKAHQSLSNTLPLKIVGTGHLMPELRKRYLGAEFAGYKTGEELKELIRRASFVVVPSEWYENCSMSVLESMAYGKPIIASRVGGMPEQIEDNKTGLLFEMGNVQELSEKMMLFTKDKELKQKMGKAARKKLEREYSLKTHCSKLMKIYEELLQ